MKRSKENINQRLLLGAIVALWLALPGVSSAQGLQFTQNPFYADSIFTPRGVVPLNISIKNNNAATATGVIVSILHDSVVYDTLIRSSNMANIPAGKTFDTTVLLNYSIDFDNRASVIFKAKSAETSIPGARFDTSVVIKYVGRVGAQLRLRNITSTDSAIFNKTHLLSMEVQNDGLVDTVINQPTQLVSMINGNPQSLDTSTFMLPPMRAERRNTVRLVDSVQMKDQYCTKGGGNIVVVWPVGFFRVDTLIDTVYVNWPIGMAEIKGLSTAVYPNPSRGALVVNDLLKFEQVRLFMPDGRLASFTMSANQLYIKEPVSGVYTLVLIKGKRCTVKQIVVMK
ncbi:hypothetical protein GC194_11320 [bacterium]|nr:hypothetical protein [bacterium]